MFTIKLKCEDKKKYIGIKEYDVPYPFNQINYHKDPNKKVYYSLESYTVKNIKGKFFIYFAKKIPLNAQQFVSSAQRVKIDGGWITNTSVPTVVFNRKVYSFCPFSADYTPLGYMNMSIHPYKYDGLNVSKYVIFQKNFLFYLSDKPADYTTGRDNKFSFPLYLIRSFDDVNNNFQFFMEYEDKTLGDFTDEEVILRIKLYNEDEVE